MLSNNSGQNPPNEKAPTTTVRASTVNNDTASVSRVPNRVHPAFIQASRAVRTATGWLVLSTHWTRGPATSDRSESCLPGGNL